MRAITAALFGAALIFPAACISLPARADTDFLGQAQRFLGNGSQNQHQNERDREAYERGRHDEMRRQQARRDQDRDRADLDRRGDWNRRDHPSEGYAAPDYRGYSER